MPIFNTERQDLSDNMLDEERIEQLRELIIESQSKQSDVSLSVDALLDAIIALYDDCQACAPPDKSAPISKFIQKCT